jgi:hypothetical protein
MLDKIPFSNIKTHAPEQLHPSSSGLQKRSDAVVSFGKKERPRELQGGEASRKKEGERKRERESEREREKENKTERHRERERATRHIYIYIHISNSYTYIYIYISIHTGDISCENGDLTTVK